MSEANLTHLDGAYKAVFAKQKTAESTENTYFK